MSVLHTDQTTFKIVGNKDLEKHALCHIISINDITDSKVYECSKKKKKRIVHIKIRKNLYCLRNTEKQLSNF